MTPLQQRLIKVEPRFVCAPSKVKLNRAEIQVLWGGGGGKGEEEEEEKKRRRRGVLYYCPPPNPVGSETACRPICKWFAELPIKADILSSGCDCETSQLLCGEIWRRDAAVRGAISAPQSVMPRWGSATAERTQRMWNIVDLHVSRGGTGRRLRGCLSVSYRFSVPPPSLTCHSN